VLSVAEGYRDAAGGFPGAVKYMCRSRPRRQPLEARIAAERGEAGVDPEPRRCDEVGLPHQRFEPRERALPIAEEQVHSDHHVIEVGIRHPIRLEPRQRQTALRLGQRFRLATEVGEREPADDVPLRIVRCLAQLGGEVALRTVGPTPALH
jgi:hypothetical protein